MVGTELEDLVINKITRTRGSSDQVTSMPIIYETSLHAYSTPVHPLDKPLCGNSRALCELVLTSKDLSDSMHRGLYTLSKCDSCALLMLTYEESCWGVSYS